MGAGNIIVLLIFALPIVIAVLFHSWIAGRARQPPPRLVFGVAGGLYVLTLAILLVVTSYVGRIDDDSGQFGSGYVWIITAPVVLGPTLMLSLLMWGWGIYGPDAEAAVRWGALWYVPALIAHEALILMILIGLEEPPA